MSLRMVSRIGERHEDLGKLKIDGGREGSAVRARLPSYYHHNRGNKRTSRGSCKNSCPSSESYVLFHARILDECFRFSTFLTQFDFTILIQTDVVNGAIFHEKDASMVVVRNIQFFSLCEHHLLPYYGVVSIGLISQPCHRSFF